MASLPKISQPGGSGGGGGTLGATATTYLDITGNKAAGSNYLLNAGGVNYLKSGDDGDLGVSNVFMDTTECILFFLNGVGLRKGVDVVWVSPNEFTLNIAVNNTDVIIVLSDATGSAAAATHTTYIDVTGPLPAASVFDVTANGVNYTKSGDDGVLLAGAALFNAAPYLCIYLNGVYQRKNVDVVWASATTFTLNWPVVATDVLLILS